MGRYRIVGELGRGGMGVVYRAVQVDLDREVALKCILPHAQEATKTGVARFKREMDVLIALAHPGIIKLYDAGEMDGQLFYAMELLKARDLGHLLKSGGPFPIPRAVSVLEQTLDALAFIHTRNLVHRDIKLANIMLEDSGRAVLMDFGLVRKIDATVLTAQGNVVGTPRYLAPEVIRGQPAGPPSDLWSLGVAAYEMLSGNRPFDGITLQEVLSDILEREPPPLSQVRPEVPAHVAQAVRGLLAKDPSGRLEAAAGRKLLLGSGSARSTGRVRRLTGRTPTLKAAVLSPASSPARAVFWVAALVAAVVIGTVTFTSSRRSEPSTPSAAAIAHPESIAVTFPALDRLVVEFQTPIAGSWSVDTGRGKTFGETVDVTLHRIEMEFSPWQPPEGLVLVRGARRFDVARPPSPVEAIRKLARAVRASGVGPATSDTIFKGLVKRARTVRRSTPLGMMRDEVASFVELADHFEREVDSLGKLRTLRPLFAAARPHVAPLLMRDDAPRELLDELFGALFALDQLDALSTYLLRPAPFGVQNALEPAVAIETRSIRRARGPRPDHGTLLFPTPGLNKVAIFPEGEMLSRGGATMKALGDVVTDFSRTRAEHSEAVSRLVFKLPARPGGAGVRRLAFDVSSLHAQGYARLVPPGFKNALPLRFPDGQVPPLDGVERLSIKLRGSLARQGGDWRVEHSRAFEQVSRPCFVLLALWLVEEP